MSTAASANGSSKESPEEPQVTIVVAPRERFSLTRRSLESLYEHADVPFELVYVDGNSPPWIASYLKEQSSRRGFKLIRSRRYLSPNQARNIGLREVKTPYVAFVDNDLIATPGWLGPMVACAEETGAWAVTPLILESEIEEQIIHMAGGDLTFTGDQGCRRVSTQHRLQGVRVPEVSGTLDRQKCDFAEFHCVLVRTDAFEKIGPLDEKLLSTREHLDLSLQVTEAGGEVFFEPGSLVAYTKPPPVAWYDIPYFLLRWSEAWNNSSLEHFTSKYGIDPSYVHEMRRKGGRRRVVFLPIRHAGQRLLGKNMEHKLAKVLAPAERKVNKALLKRPEAVGSRDDVGARTS